MAKLGYRIAVITIFLCCCGFGGFGIYFINQNHTVQNNYLTTTGRVVSADIGERYTLLKGTNRKIYHYSPEISYRYRINGRDYEADRYTLFTTESDQQTEISTLLDYYRPGSEVVIYYNPENPEEAVLNRNSSLALPYIFITLSLVTGAATAAIKILFRIFNTKKVLKQPAKEK